MKTKLLTLFLALCLMLSFALSSCAEDPADGTNPPADGNSDVDGSNQTGNTDHSNPPPKPASFTFEPTEDGLGYTLVAITLDSPQKVNIPATYEGKAVLAIADNISIAGGGTVTELKIPDSVTHIGENAFVRHDALTKVSFGSGLKSMGAYAFFGCKNLRTIELSANNTAFIAGYNCLVEVSSKTLVLGTFNCSIPELDAVTTIRSGAFGYYDIGSITIPESVKTIEENAFYGCKVTNFHFEGTMEDWDFVEKHENWRKDSNSFPIICEDGNVTEDDSIAD